MRFVQLLAAGAAWLVAMANGPWLQRKYPGSRVSTPAFPFAYV